MRFASAVFAACSLAAACQFAVDDDPQCKSDADCVHQFGPAHVCGGDGVCRREFELRATDMPDFPDEWACLSNATNGIGASVGSSVSVALQLYNLATGQPVPNAMALACLDPGTACARPVGEPQVSDAQGSVRFELPYGFNGHYEMQAAGFVPVLLPDQPLRQHTAVRVPVPAQTSLAALALRDGQTYDAGRGVVLLELVDCYGAPASEVRLEIDGALQSPSLSAGAAASPVNNAALGSLSSEPSIQGRVGFFNVAPGIVTVEVSALDSGRHITKITFQVRAGTLSFIHFEPRLP